MESETTYPETTYNFYTEAEFYARTAEPDIDTCPNCGSANLSFFSGDCGREYAWEDGLECLNCGLKFNGPR